MEVGQTEGRMEVGQPEGRVTAWVKGGPVDETTLE